MFQNIALMQPEMENDLAPNLRAKSLSFMHIYFALLVQSSESNGQSEEAWRVFRGC